VTRPEPLQMDSKQTNRWTECPAYIVLHSVAWLQVIIATMT